MRSSARSRLLIATCVVAVLSGVTAQSSASATSAARHVKPGASVTIADVHCRVGVMLHQGATVYAGVPASCGALPLSEGAPQWGCEPHGQRQTAASAPIGTPVRVAGQTHRAILVYDSFTRMQVRGIKRINECQFNELILIKLNPADAKAARGTSKVVVPRPPSAGTALKVGKAGATAMANAHHGWVYPLKTSAALTPAQIGTSVTHGSTLVGMLTALPQGAVMKTPAATYNLQRAIDFAKKAPCVEKFHACFSHLKLLTR